MRSRKHYDVLPSTRRGELRRSCSTFRIDRCEYLNNKSHANASYTYTVLSAQTSISHQTAWDNIIINQYYLMWSSIVVAWDLVVNWRKPIVRKNRKNDYNFFTSYVNRMQGLHVVCILRKSRFLSRKPINIFTVMMIVKIHILHCHTFLMYLC